MQNDDPADLLLACVYALISVAAGLAALAFLSVVAGAVVITLCD